MQTDSRRDVLKRFLATDPNNDKSPGAVVLLDRKGLMVSRVGYSAADFNELLTIIRTIPGFTIFQGDRHFDIDASKVEMMARYRRIVAVESR